LAFSYVQSIEAWIFESRDESEIRGHTMR
jgi:hypothetical protein